MKTKPLVVKVKCRQCGYLCGPMVLPGPEGTYYNCEKCQFALFGPATRKVYDVDRVPNTTKN